MSKQVDNPYVKSIRSNLRNLARERKVLFLHIENQFLIERAVARLVKDVFIYNHLIFKGGYVGLRVYNSPRYTMDLDAVVYQLDRNQVLGRVKTALQEDIGDHVWFVFEKQVDLSGQSEYGGARLAFKSGVGQVPLELKRCRNINIDIGVGDPVTPYPRKENLPLTVGEGQISWYVYPVESIIAEKVHPFVALWAQNSRSKDLFDLYYLLPRVVNLSLLKKAIDQTFKFRGDKVPDSFCGLFSSLDLKLVEQGWSSAVSSLENAPSFRVCINFVIEWFRVNKI